ncbi:MAG: hypothetical protein J3Q66DRAFT_336198 [Benniella sp.]|nr:MAG: hypothetical protein J3Q66DRAFT_336198 [Benniella sp.]
MNRMPWVLPDTLTSSANNSTSWFAGARSKKDKDNSAKKGALRSSDLGTDHNRNSVCSVNTFGKTLDMSFLSASASVSAPTSSEHQESESFVSSTDAVGTTSTAPQSKGPKHKRIGSTFGFLQDLQRQQCGLIQSPFTSQPTEPRDDDLAHDKGVGSGSEGRAKGRDEGGPAHGKTTSRNPKAPQTSTPNPPLVYDPSLLESEICALRYQIRQATTVLTHVVQTMSVPSPTALINVMQDTAHQKGQTQGHQPHPNGCSCAILHARDDGKFGTGREIAFLAACYCPDPWGFQERVLRQIDLMQQEIQTLRQEMLEVERRATISLRQEMLEWERVRDKEWVELNERLQRSLVVGESDNEERMNFGEPRCLGASFERYARTESGSPPSAYSGSQDIEVLDSGAEDYSTSTHESKERSTCQSGDQGADPNELPVDNDEVVYVIPKVDTSSAL